MSSTNRSYSSIPNLEPSSSRSPPSSRSSSMTSRSGSRAPLRRGTKGYAGNASFISSIVNLLNTILGAGVLAMPLAMSHMGLTLGIIVIVCSGMISGFGLYLQARCARYVERGQASFFSLSLLTYPSASVLFDGAIAVKCFGVGVSYLIIIGDLMPQVVVAFNPGAVDHPYLVDRHFWITVFMLVIIPLAFLRRLDSLKYTSVIALTSIGYLVIIVVAHYLKGDTLGDRGKVEYVKWMGPIEALSSFPIIVFGYTCHQNMFSIVNEIKDNSLKNTTKVVGTSSLVSISLYILVAITGYLSFGDNVGGNIIAMYPQNVASTIGRAAIVILVMFSYPLQCHPCRASIDHVLKWRPSKDSLPSHQRHNGNEHGGRMSDTRFAILTSIIIVLSFITAMTVTSLERVFAYVGSTGSTSISFILPGLFYWNISRPGRKGLRLVSGEDSDSDDGDDDDDADHSIWSRWALHVGAGVLAIYGVVVMVLCLTMNFFFSATGH